MGEREREGGGGCRRTDRQTGIQRDRQTDRQKHRQIEEETETARDTETDTQLDKTTSPHLVEWRVEKLTQGVTAREDVGENDDVTKRCGQDAHHSQAHDGNQGQGQPRLPRVRKLGQRLNWIG